jgi:hypothetical protein
MTEIQSETECCKDVATASNLFAGRSYHISHRQTPTQTRLGGLGDRL